MLLLLIGNRIKPRFTKSTRPRTLYFIKLKSYKIKLLKLLIFKYNCRERYRELIAI